MVNDADFIKKGDDVWQEGTGQGGMISADNPISPNLWYHQFMITKFDGTYDFAIATDITGSSVLADPVISLAGYVKIKYITSRITNASANFDIVNQFGDDCWFGEDRLISSADPSVFTTLAISAPPGVELRGFLSSAMTQLVASSGGFSPDLFWRKNGSTEDGLIVNTARQNTGGAVGGSGSTFTVNTNSSAEIQYYYSAHDNAAAAFNLWSLGWSINRGSL